MKSANDNEVNDDVGARELYDEMDIRFPNLFFSPLWTSVINTKLGSLGYNDAKIALGESRVFELPHVTEARIFDVHHGWVT
jgi:hypothetical protein